MNARNWGLLFLLSLLWGSSFFFYKVLVAVLPPVTVVLGRLGIAAIALNLWLLAQGTRLPLTPRLAARFLLLGFLNNSLPFVLIAWGETRINSGLASVLNATTPIFMVLVAHWGTRDDRLSWAKAAGIGFGILGTMVLVGREAFTGQSALWGELAVIGASAAYGLGGVYSRSFKDLAPPVAATGQITGGALLLLPVAALADKPWQLPMPGWQACAALLAIALVNTAAAYVVFFRLLALSGATFVSLCTFLIPIIALFLGAVFLGEQVTVQAAAGMAIIALGLAAIDGRLLRRLGRSPAAVN